MVEINGVQYEKPYITMGTEDRAKLTKDALSHRMGFHVGTGTTDLGEVIRTPDGKHAFPHPACVGFADWQTVIEGVTTYAVVEFDPTWLPTSAE